MKEFLLSLVGKIKLPSEIDEIFSLNREFLITRVLEGDHFFEMGGESAYYAIQELEMLERENYYSLKLRIVDAIKKRLLICGGKLLHKSFTGTLDTQFRSTNSALRTLLAAGQDGFDVDNEISSIANYQYQFYFNWRKGIWFCHDSSELDGKVPLSHLRIPVYEKKMRNTLTINTHLDSLNTLFLLKKYGKQHLLNFDLNGHIKKGLLSVNYLLDATPSFQGLSSYFQKKDMYILDKVLDRVNQHHSIGKLFFLYEKIIHPILFKVLFPTIFFDNGCIARDLSIMNRHIDYLTVNIVDFLRVLSCYKAMSDEERGDVGALNVDLLEEKILAAINLIETNDAILKYIMNDDLQRAWYGEIYYTLSNVRSSFIPKAKELYQQDLYCTCSPFFKPIFR